MIEDIRADTLMSSALAGVLTAIPFVCMGTFAFLGPPLVQRLGTPRVVVASLASIAVGSLARSFAEAAWLVLATTLPIGLGIALIGVTLPAVVKARFPERAGAATGAYVASLSVGVAIVGFGLVPLADALGGWREALAVTALPALAGIWLWIGAGEGRTRTTDPDAPPLPASFRVGAARALAAEALARVRRVRPSRPALLLGTVFGLQSMSFAGMVSWAPAVYEEAGWSQGTAALTTSSIGIYTIVSALVFPPLSDGHDRRLWISVIGVAMGIGVLGVGVLTTTGAWLWLTMFGLGTGAVFPLMLALPLDLHDRPREVAELSAWMLGLGFFIAGFSPILVGGLRDITGEFTVPISLLAAAAVTAAALILLAPPPRRR